MKIIKTVEIEEIFEAREEITPVYLEGILMPNRELIFRGITLGYISQYGRDVRIITMKEIKK
jgi:hypothetical protein